MAPWLKALQICFSFTLKSDAMIATLKNPRVAQLLTVSFRLVSYYNFFRRCFKPWTVSLLSISSLMMSF